MKLSVLDQSVIQKGENAGEAFRQTAELAQAAEKLGYTRFWVAEHHNTNGLAGSSPEILISHLASQTERIRVGSGGVLLPQYSPLKVAENFKVLEALFPNRIDLGIGRSPGGNAATRMALTDGVAKSLNEFPRQVKDLKGYLLDDLPQGHEYHEVKAAPEIHTLPEVWHLGLTERGARTAAEQGVGFTFGHFIAPGYGRKAVETYTKHFIPSPLLSRPKVNVCIFVICAPTEEEAEDLAWSQDMWLLSVEKSHRADTRLIPVDEAKSLILTTEDEQRIKQNRKRAVIGTPEFVRKELVELSERYQTDEFIVLTNIFDYEKKLQSYRLLAEAFDLKSV
ncbi:MAG TPA: LLM class flavin-dependent oxidoreductase [Chondromyces sp.]|nr:LLM class flavin-dependent oxidoreductase [Chondromyces sp.]